MKLIEILEEFTTNMMSIGTAEAIILEVLDLHIKNQGKDFFLDFNFDGNDQKSLRLPYDGVAPQGFDNFVGATGIEIKFIRDKNTLLRTMRNLIEKSSFTKNGNPLLENVLLIVLLSLTQEEKENLTSKFNDIPFKLTIWDSNDLKNLFNKYPEKVIELENNPSIALMNLVVKKGLNASNNNWKLQRNEHLYNLRNCFKDDELVLFLGAGVSYDANIPTWNDLISNLMVSLLDTVIKDERFDGHFELSKTEKEALVKDIQEKNGNSPVQLVRFIRNGLGNLFREELRKTLYKKYKKSSRILEALTDLCIPLRHGIGIQGVVTYNFDDLLEVNFKNKKVINFRPVFKEADIPSKNELGVYHVHGFLPNTPHEYGGIEDQRNSLLVFSEEEYHQLMLDPYHWANLVQLNYFRENTCLFIGTSMTDPNVRRLLEIARKKQPEKDKCKHYIILKRDSFSEVNRIDSVDNENIDKFAMIHQQLKEAELSELGLNVIWVDKHEDIPELLDSLRL
ncbi:SIR2 family protein [Bacillus cereus]|nr:SIR2 family protein [Bacillus cereus]